VSAVSASEIAARLAERIDALVGELLPAARRDGTEWRVGSVAGEPGSSMAVHRSGPKTGIWCDFSTGERGDALDLVAAVLFRGDKRGAFAWARGWLALDAPQRATRPHPASVRRDKDAVVDEERAAKVERARYIWREAGPLAGTLGEVYLRGRAIELPSWPPTLRFHPALSFGSPRDGTVFPAIIAAVQQPSREVRGVWRIYLRHDGSGKAPVQDPRRGLGEIAPGALRLTPPAEELVLGEGLETCLSVLVADPRRAVWAGLSASLMRRVELPAVVSRVLLLEENDAPDVRGRRASPDTVSALATRFTAEGRGVRIVRVPAAFKDTNDLLTGSTMGERHVA
jgi:hypothetical protein